MAEAIDWVAALSALGAPELASEQVRLTLGTLAKTPTDRDLLAEALERA